jgi:NAD(P)-dependent dehydrogenase (short-subunit alcohol dehydrogenase family)
VIAAEAAKTGQSEAAVREGLTAISSLRTLISPEDIANTILFLTSAAGERISGQDITVDGHTETL